MRFFFAVFSVLLYSAASANTYIDSIGVENENGNQVILHKVESKETYYSIGRIYNISPQIIQKANNAIALHIGTVLKVPTLRPYSSAKINVPQVSTGRKDSETDIIEYKVGPKEYLYSIAKRFNTTIEEIKELNNLKSNNLKIGQLIKVRQGKHSDPLIPVEKPVVVIQPDTNASNSDGEEEDKLVIKPGRLGVTEKSEKGVAVWIADENLDGSKMLALHRFAPIGTVVKVTNPMTGRVTFVKVVGKFTENQTTKDVIIVLTKGTADLLGALDKRFLVTIDYGMPNE